MKTLEKLSVCIFFIIGFAITSFSQTWTNYTTESTSHHLCSNQINCIIIDSKNNKWFGTDKGISVFDGEDWISYDSTNGLPSNHITTGAIDKDGVLWFGTISGSVVKYDEHEWKSYTSKEQLPGDRILTIAVDKQNNKWFGAEGSRITVYDNSQWKQKDLSYLNGYSPESYDISAIVFDTMDRALIGYTSCDWGFILSADTTYGFNECPEDEISCMVIDEENALWVGSAFGVIKYKNRFSEKFENINNQTWSHVSSIFIDENNNKWIGTIAGLAQFDNKNWISYTTQDGLIGDEIKAITMDHEGNLWVGTKSGISVLNLATATVPYINMNSWLINIFPNPSTAEITIYSPNNLRAVEIYDLIGNLKEKEYTLENSITINISDFEAGLYIVKVGDNFMKIIVE